MPRGRVFLVGSEPGTLRPLDETVYANEDILQTLLEDYPDLLPGDQINPDVPRRWLLVAREMGVPAAADQSDRWSLDHLYLDQDATPTFVECKRSSDTRARREVVAQMLDYAANGLAHWTIDRLRQAATETTRRRGNDIDTEVRTLVGAPEDADVEAFWQQVEANLRTGRVRLIFVADSIPNELRRLVEFLNDRLAEVEVLAVEVKQFLGAGDHKVIVPRLIGMTERGRAKPSVIGPRSTTNREQFLAACTPAAREIMIWMLDEAQRRSYTVYWGNVGFSVRQPVRGVLTSFLYGYPSDRIEAYAGHVKLEKEIVADLRREWVASGILRPSGEFTARPSLESTSPEAVKAALTMVMDSVDALGSAT